MGSRTFGSGSQSSEHDGTAVVHVESALSLHLKTSDAVRHDIVVTEAVESRKTI
jgi:hypothetical protein